MGLLLRWANAVRLYRKGVVAGVKSVGADKLTLDTFNAYLMLTLSKRDILLIVEDCKKKEIYLSACGMTEDAQELLDRTRQEILRLQVKEQTELQGEEDAAWKAVQMPYKIKVTPNFEKELNGLND